MNICSILSRLMLVEKCNSVKVENYNLWYLYGSFWRGTLFVLNAIWVRFYFLFSVIKLN